MSQRLSGVAMSLVGIVLLVLSAGWLVINRTVANHNFLPERHETFSFAVGSVAVEFSPKVIASVVVILAIVLFASGRYLIRRSRQTPQP